MVASQAPLPPDPSDAEAVRAALRCGRSGCPCRSGPNVHCPAHDDDRPSLTVSAGRDGRLLVNCKAGCAQMVVLTTLRERGLWGSRRSPSRTSRTSRTDGTGATSATSRNGAHPTGSPGSPGSPASPVKGAGSKPPAEPVAVYEYRAATDPHGPVIAQKARWESSDGAKTFRWRRAGRPGWEGLDGLSLDDLALWGVELIADRPGEPVVVVEGEKAALAARSLGLLAVCHPGGASTRRFTPDQLAPLSGRDVILWPDNDAPGRELMARLAAALRPVARSVRFLTPSLPVKGDAADYVAQGGTREALLAELPPVRPDVTVLGRDTYRVRVPTPAGVVTLTFDGLEQSGHRELEAEVTVAVPGSDEPLVQRLNLLSGSQRTDLRRDLDALYGKEHGWTAVLAVACGLVWRAWRGQERAVRVDQIVDPGTPQFLVDVLLPEGSPTVLFGDGSSGKTYLALALGVAVALGRTFCQHPTRQGAVLYVDYETSEAQFRLRVERLCRGLGLDGIPSGLPMYYWRAGGIPLSEQVDVLRRFCAENGIVLVIVDAAADACGGEPESAAVASRYFNALARLGELTTLTIAHIAKGSDTEKPFGSVVWHNRPRRTWYVQRVQEEDADEADLGLFCRKGNDGRRPSPLAFHLAFDGVTGPVTVRRGDISAIPELAERRPLRDRLRDLLRGGARSVGELHEALGGVSSGISREAVLSALRRSPQTFVEVERGGGRGRESRWGLRAQARPGGSSAPAGADVGAGDSRDDEEEPWWVR